jgi:aminoglycoside 6'-N-acetyltransferase
MTDADLPIVVDWLAQPHVHRWWHLGYDLAAVTKKYGPRLRGEDPTHMLIVESDAAPVGLAQWYRWDDYTEDRDNYRIGKGELGFDYAIGEPSTVGRGVGTIMIARLLDLLRDVAAPGMPVTVTPEAANTASRRVLEKNGFVHTATFQSEHLEGQAPEGPTTLYRRLL